MRERELADLQAISLSLVESLCKPGDCRRIEDLVSVHSASCSQSGDRTGRAGAHGMLVADIA
jgi:hypothetical protein